MKGRRRTKRFTVTAERRRVEVVRGKFSKQKS
jgi:hypothetical protein